MTSLRWGILGTGWIASSVTADLVANGFTVSAVGSRAIQSAEAFAETFGIPAVHGSYEALVADPEVDVIYVSTPHPYHFPNAMLALEAGKHVLVEKPFTLNAGEAAEVVALAESKNLVVLEAMWTRWLPTMVRLREIIAAGTIGEVRTVIADHNQKLSTDPLHRINNPDLGGGALLDLGIYPVSFAWDMLGEPSSVAAIGTMTATGVDRQTAILLGYPGGQQALLQCCLDTAGSTTATVIGTEGWAHIEGAFFGQSSFTVYSTSGAIVERYEAVPAHGGRHFQAWELERIVASGRTAGSVLAPSETVAIMGTLDEIRRQIGLRYPGE